MITKEDVKSIMSKKPEEKSALLEEILNSMQKVEPLFEEKKKSAEDLKEKSKAAEEDIIKLLNGHIRRLETEKIELNMEMAEAKEDLKQVDEVKEELAQVTTELEQAKSMTELALKEKDDVEKKLVKIQEQWQKFINK